MDWGQQTIKPRTDCLFLISRNGLVPLPGWPRPSALITQDTYDKISTGMTEAQVESLLGKPIDGGRKLVIAGGIKTVHLPEPMQGSIWRHGRREIVVYFSEGKVVGKELTLGYERRK